MKQLRIAAGILAMGLGLMSCGGAHGDDPGHAYMPDMYYSRAYETYGYNDVGGEYDSLKARRIFYNGLPVAGTIARGDSLQYYYTATGDSAQLAEASTWKSPLDSAAATKGNMKEAERLYLVNCGICHGPALNGNGPIVAGGAYPAQPKDLTAADAKAFPDGHYFYVITNGIRSMGSYKSQLTPMQRWWVIKYIRSKQGPATSDSTAKTTAVSGHTAATKDSTKQAK